MTQLVLVRHGAAAAGDDGDDPELSDQGRRQVATLADRLRGQTFSALCHSPGRRAAQTAEPLRTGVPLEPTISWTTGHRTVRRPATRLLREPVGMAAPSPDVLEQRHASQRWNTPENVILVVRRRSLVFLGAGNPAEVVGKLLDADIDVTR